jgi:hypothetical protein
MISCVLQGGLGNQMFQIAATTGFAFDNNDQACFNLNFSNTILQGNPSHFYRENIYKNICYSENLTFDNAYHEPKFSYTEIPYQPNLLLNGYFQSEKYFINHKDLIINLFELPIEFVKKPISNLTSVHIRRGDYVKLNDYHSLLDIEYYNKSIELIGDGSFIFFSDDIEWVKQNFIGGNFYYSQYDNEILDLSLMSICDNNIIANSSFSWWGAYLNKNNDKKVIAPSQWFGPRGPKDTQDITPENWIKI